MDSLIFSLNATVPVFLLMLLGILFRRLGWLDKELAEKLNSFVFRVPLPLVVFQDLAAVDMSQAWDGRFVLFCFAASVLCVTMAWALSYVWHDRSIQGEFIQASYRSSAAIMAVALVQNMYGEAGMVPLMMLGSVPLYNIASVVALSMLHEDRRGLDAQALRATARGIVTNPIIQAIICGVLWSVLRLPMPAIAEKTVSSLGSMGTPLGLMAMGATFDMKKVAGHIKPTVVASGLKLVVYCVLLLPIAVAMGFREQKLAAILVMLGSCTTVSCYVMARNMGHEGVLTSGVVMLTTLLSAFTVTFWLWLLRSLGLI